MLESDVTSHVHTARTSQFDVVTCQTPPNLAFQPLHLLKADQLVCQEPAIAQCDPVSSNIVLLIKTVDQLIHFKLHCKHVNLPSQISKDSIGACGQG